MILLRVAHLRTRLLVLGVLVTLVCLLVGTQANGQAATDAATSSAPSKKTIQAAQERLLALGYQPGVADGVMGAKAIAALKKFQSDHSLPITGVLDPKTTDALDAANASSDKKPMPSAVSTNKETASPPLVPESLVGKRYLTSEHDILFFLKDGDVAERNGHYGVLYANQSAAFDANGQNPTTWCKYQQEQSKVTITCDHGVGAEFTINRDGSLTGPAEGMWGETAFARLAELK
jgi:peptidoglycan hydrolase-like protein with peptidoglycan-binding domain